MQKSPVTVVRGCEEMCISASPSDRGDLHAFLARSRTRTQSSCSNLSSISSIGEMDSPLVTEDEDTIIRDVVPMSPETPNSPLYRPQRIRFISDSEESTPGTLTEVSANTDLYIIYLFIYLL